MDALRSLCVQKSDFDSRGLTQAKLSVGSDRERGG